MTHEPNDGGPAFPTVETEWDTNTRAFNGNVYSVGGMSLLDYFAAAAGAAMYANDGMVREAVSDWIEQGGERPTCVAEWFAGMAYEFADAMLAERNKRAAAQGGAE